MTWIQNIQHADTVLKELGLGRCKNTIIGGLFMRGVSGGERKHTSIGYDIRIPWILSPSAKFAPPES
jgi:hypothetical protein